MVPSSISSALESSVIVRILHVMPLFSLQSQVVSIHIEDVLHACSADKCQSRLVS